MARASVVQACSGPLRGLELEGERTGPVMGEGKQLLLWTEGAGRKLQRAPRDRH